MISESFSNLNNPTILPFCGNLEVSVLLWIQLPFNSPGLTALTVLAHSTAPTQPCGGFCVGTLVPHRGFSARSQPGLQTLSSGNVDPLLCTCFSPALNVEEGFANPKLCT